MKESPKKLDEGVPYEQTKGRLNKWVTGVYLKNKRANNIRLYGGMVYIFCNEILVTVMHIPSNLMKDFKKMVK